MVSRKSSIISPEEARKKPSSRKAVGTQKKSGSIVIPDVLPDFYTREGSDPFVQTAMTFSRLLDPSLLIEEIVPFEKWIEDPYYSGQYPWEAWVGVKENAAKILTSSEKGGNFFVITGGIGTGKTKVSEIVAQYEAYRLLCHGSPAMAAGLKSQSSVVVFALFSTKYQKAADVVYKRLRNNIATSKWFREHRPYNERMLSRIEWPNLVITPMPSTVQSAVSEDVFLAIIDEANLWTSSAEAENVEEVVSKVQQRMESRFESNYRILVASSGDSADSYTEKVRDTASLYLAMTPWESRGEQYDYYFFVDPGDKFTPPRIIETDTEAKKVIRIPLKYKPAAEADLITFLRDRVGLGVSGRKHLYSVSILHYPWLDNKNQEEYLLDEIPQLHLDESEEPRVIHVDIGLTQDWCGIACGYIADAAWERKESDMAVFVPKINYDFAIRVRAPVEGGETDLDMVRRMIFEQVCQKRKTLKITYDGWQSADSIQIFTKKGYDAKRISVDRTPEPHHYLKRLFTEERIKIPYSSVLVHELRHLFIDPKTKKVDHPKRVALENSSKTMAGSKDVADAVAGVAWNCYNAIAGKVIFDPAGEAEIECRVFSLPRMPKPRMRF